jgi:hydroxyacylglutathione hydrolase
MRVDVISTEELGDRSYVVRDGQTAIVIDPQRDLDRVEAALAEAGVRVSLVLETHVHNDYVTGGYELARRSGARYAVSGRDDVRFDRVPVSDGDELQAGSLRVAVVPTPGHTDNHLAYVVTDVTRPNDPPAVFTGGSLQFGGVGRTDLIDPDRTVELTHAQYHSARLLAEMLPDAAAVYPTHGFGSFCSAGSSSSANDSTIGQEKRSNDALVADDEDRFVDELVANLGAYPAYYVHMSALNQRGPTAPDLSAPQTVDSVELGKRLAAGQWVVDLRDRKAYAAGHVADSVGIELASEFATYIGWIMPWGSPLTVIGESPGQVADAQRQLIRIGVDRLAGAATGEIDDLAGEREVRGYPRTDFAAARRNLAAGDVVLDVRRDEERQQSHIAGSAHIPIHELPGRLRDVPAGRLWVHCATGYRASIGASLLDRAGRQVVLIDDDYDDAEPAGFPIA